MWLLALVVGAFSLSCRKDLDKISASKWQPILAAPFIQSDITMRNIIGSDTNIYTTPDSLLVYFYQNDSVFRLTADSVLQPPDEIVFEHNYSLGAIKVDQEFFDETFTLDEMLNFIDDDIADSIRKYDGTMHLFPPFGLLEPASQIFSPSENYEYLTFSEGILLVEVTNTMPVSFNDIQFKLEDLDFGQLSKSITIPSLAPSETYTDSISLADLTVGNEFGIEFTYFVTPGSFPDEVFIELQQGFVFKLIIKGGEVIAGKGKIDEQKLISDIRMIEYDAPDGEKLFHTVFRQGELDYQFESGLPMDAGIEVKFPSAELDGQIPETEFELKSGETLTENTSVDGLSIDYTTDPDQPYNLFPIDFSILLPPTNEMVIFDSSDNVKTTFVFTKIKLFYADGYFGKKEFTVSSDTTKTDLDFLNQLQGEIILTEPEVKIIYSNEIGLPIKFLPVFIGINTTTDQTQNFDADSITFNAPEQPGETVYGEIKYDNTNSSIVDFIAIRPNLIVYDGGGITNWDEPEFNFIYDTALFIGNAEVKIPMIFKSSFLAFTDTVKISSNETDSHLKEGLLVANVLNGFPLEMELELLVPDSVTGDILETVKFNTIASAPVDESGKVTQPVETEVTGAFDENFLASLKRANQVYVYTRSATYENGTLPVGLYSDYVMKTAIAFQVVVQP